VSSSWVFLDTSSNSANTDEGLKGTHSYGILCSDFKSSGLAAEEKENSKPANKKEKDDKGKGKATEKGKGKGKGKGKEEEEKPKSSKKKKPKGLFAIEWFRIGESRLQFITRLHG
jgi:hypothetical protein